MNAQDVRALLEGLADTPPPPSRVDVARAMAMARRRARARLWTSAAASILVVGVAAGVTYAVIDRAPATSDTPTANQAPANQAPRRFDPLLRYASFGWLPGQLTWRNTAISADRFELSATAQAPDAANVNVRLYAAGAVPQTEQPMDVWTPEGTKTMRYGPVTSAPAVNGAPAYWVGVPYASGEVVLKWRYSLDGWAELSAARVPGDLRETMHRIASELRVGGTERLRFPFHLTGLSPKLRPASSQFEEGGPDGPWYANLDLNTRSDGKGPGLSVAVHPTNTADTHTPNTAVDGRPARRETVGGDHLGVSQYSDRLFVTGVEGLQVNVFIDAATAEAAAPLALDGVLGVYRALTVHPGLADWTDRPLR